MNYIVNVIIKQGEVIRWKWRIKEFSYIQIWTHICDKLTHERARGDMSHFFQKGVTFITGRAHCYCITGRQISLAKKQVKLPDEIVSVPSLNETENNICGIYRGKDWTKPVVSNGILNYLRSWLNATSYSGNLEWVPESLFLICSWVILIMLVSGPSSQ